MSSVSNNLTSSVVVAGHSRHTAAGSMILRPRNQYVLPPSDIRLSYTISRTGRPDLPMVR